MALRLVRETSETPNITNKDDAIMVRYAYGGYNGIVKGFGNECGYTAENGIFKVLDGRIVIDGWEIDIDGAGWSIDLHNITGIQYHSIFVEINVATESIKLDSTYLTGAYPNIDKGDDLTAIQNGTARLLLYQVKVENGKITEVLKKFEIIRHIKERLDELGFRKGVAIVEPKDTSYPNIVLDANSLKKQGKYCIFNFLAPLSQFADYYKIIIPEGFRPKEKTQIVAIGSSTMNYNLPIHNIITITPDGVLDTDGIPPMVYFQILNAGWEIL